MSARVVIANQLNGHHGDRQGCTGYSGCTTCADDILAALDRAGFVVAPKKPTNDTCEWEKSGVEYYEYRTSCGVFTSGPNGYCYNCERPVKIGEQQ